MSDVTIGDVLDAIDGVDDEKYVRFDFGHLSPTKIDSWRGVYSEAAIGFSSGGYGDQGCSVGVFRTELLSAIEQGTTYEGWKGGEYQYSRKTPLHVDNRGCCTNTEIERIEVTDYDVILHTKSGAP